MKKPDLETIAIAAVGAVVAIAVRKGVDKGYEKVRGHKPLPQAEEKEDDTGETLAMATMAGALAGLTRYASRRIAKYVVQRRW